MDCVKQNTVDAGLPDLLLPLEARFAHTCTPPDVGYLVLNITLTRTRHMFFMTANKEEEVKSDLDEFNDSYARDTTANEIKDILERMSEEHNFDSTQSPDTITKITERIQERASSGYETPIGWLFRGLTFYFNRPQPDETKEIDQAHNLRTVVVANIARFASAEIVSDMEDRTITHVIMDPDTPAAEISAFRGSLAARGAGRKVPHIVTSKWIEESWDAKTLLDEESEFYPLFVS